MAIYTIITWSLSIRTYLIIDEVSRKAAIIDPTRNIEPILELLEEHGGNLTYIFESHVHADFVSGAKELKAKLNGKPIIACSALGGKEWIPSYVDQTIHDREKFDLGSLSIQAWHTPGHTPEHLMFVLLQKDAPIAAFTGDFLFAGSIGRPDLLGKKELDDLSKKLFNSIFTVLPELPRDLRVLPAHGSGSLCGKEIATQEESTLEKEWASNPSLIKMDMAQWTDQLLKDMPKAPAYFARMKELNITGAPLLNTLPSVKQIDPSSLHYLNLSDYFLLDVRNQELFASHHIRNSVNIPWSANFLRWAGEFIPPSKPVIIIANNRDETAEVIKALHLIGIDQIGGFILADVALWDQVDSHISSFPMPQVDEILTKLDEYLVIDVRTILEWNKGHIPSAKHHEINTLSDALNNFQRNTAIAFICGSGYRASIAASFAKQAGFKTICNIRGGMQAWNQADLPIEKD